MLNHDYIVKVFAVPPENVSWGYFRSRNQKEEDMQPALFQMSLLVHPVGQKCFPGVGIPA